MIIAKIRQLLAIFLLCTLTAASFADTLDTQLSSDKVSLGETIVVTYTLNNANRVSPDFSVLNKDFRIVNTNYGTAINMINGATASQTFWRLGLQPNKAGELTIPEVTFGNDKSVARKITVTSAAAAPSPTSMDKHNSAIFITGEINTTTPYVQSQVLYNFKVYYRSQVREPRMEFPQLKGVAFFQLGDGQNYQTTINGKVYNVVEKNFAFFPKEAGTVHIPPVKLYALMIDDNLSYRDDPFNFDLPKPVTLATKDYTLSVRDIPRDFPGKTWLPAKNITLSEIWSEQSSQWEAGTPVTRTITLTAEGLRADQLPDLTVDKIKGLNVYIDRPKRNDNFQENMIVGTLELKVTYIPNHSQSFSIPPIKLNWWNTEKNANAVAELKGMVVYVNGGTAKSTQPPAAINPAAALAALNPSSTKPEATTPAGYQFYQSIWFWIACALCAGWALTIILLRRKYEDPVNKNEVLATKLTEKEFIEACKVGDGMTAQQYLLSWAKPYLPNGPVNLATLCEVCSDSTFNEAIAELEKVLYSKKATAWHGEKLLEAYLKVKKAGNIYTRHDKEYSSKIDPLPPLNPAK